MGNRKTILAILVAVLLLAGAAAISLLIFRMARGAVEQQVAAVLKPEEKQVDLSVLVTHIRDLNRLETASMRVLHIARTAQSYKMVPNALAGDEITFLAAGDVIAGIDLSQLRQEDIWRSPDGTVNLRLPPSQILVSRVDNKESRVLTRKTGALRRADVDLETRARQHAEENIRAEALKKGILPLASRNAEARLADLLHTLGAEKVRFVNPAPRPANL